MAGHNHLLYQSDDTEGGSVEKCIQEEHINDIKDMLKEISRAVSQVAAQDERLDGMDKKNEEQDKSLNVLYERVRVIDMTLGKNGESIKLKVHTAIMDGLTPLLKILEIMNSRAFVMAVVALAALVAVGAICDLAYHNDLVKQLFKLVPM